MEPFLLLGVHDKVTPAPAFESTPPAEEHVMKRQNFRRIPRPELSASSKKALRGAVSTLNSPWAASLARAFASASALILCWVSSMSTSSSAGSFLPAATVGAWREGVAFNKVGVSKAIAVRYATINRYKLFKLPLQR